MDKTILLTADAIASKLKRIAIEIVENNFVEKEIVLLGIVDRGAFIADCLKIELEKQNNWKVDVGYISIHKAAPLLHPVELKLETSLENKVVILVDDVANSGKTMFYALKPLMDTYLKKLQIAVLVDRQHKEFAITPDYVGISISTTLQEMIFVQIGNEVKEPVAYLN